MNIVAACVDNHWTGPVAALRCLVSTGLALALFVGCGNGDGPEDTKTGDTTAESAGSDGGPGADVGDATTAGDGDSGPTPGDADVASGGVLVARSLRYDEDLRGIWGSGPADVWIVGAKGRILHWNGKALAPRASGTTKDLDGVAGRGPKDVWFAGDGVVLHWNGVAIVDKTPPELPGVKFHSVNASSDGTAIYVAGDAGKVARQQGGVWTSESTASALNLRSLWASDNGLVWAVGDQGQALKRTGGVWTGTAIPKATKTLRAVTGSPEGRFFAAGEGGFLGVNSGGVWESTASNDNDNRDLLAVWAPSDTVAWALGRKGALLKFTPKNKKWELAEIAGNFMKLATFAAVWGQAPKGGAAVAFAVGPDGAGLRYQGDKWLDWKMETDSELRAVAAAVDGGLYAVGSGGLFLHAADAQASFFDLAAPVTGTDLNDVATVGNGAWAVGAGGIAVFRPGPTAAAGSFLVEQAAGQTLRAVALVGSAPAGELVAVGDGGVAVVRPVGGGAWQAQVTGTQLPLHGVAAAGGVAYAVGDVGTILRRDASGKWQGEDAGEIVGLRRVVAWSADEALAVGEHGAMLVRQGGKWQRVFEAPGFNLFGATRKADGTLIAVGYSGAVVVGKVGGKFKQVDSQVKSMLFGVAATAKGTVVVGQKGGVFALAENLP